MANLGYIISGGGPVIKKYLVDAGTPDFTIAGSPAIASATSESGVAPMAAGTLADYVGLSLDTATYTATQATIQSTGPGIISLVVNPDAVIRLRMSGSGTAEIGRAHV